MSIPRAVTEEYCPAKPLTLTEDDSEEKFTRPPTPMYPDSPIWTPIDDNEQKDDGQNFLQREEDKMRALEEKLILKMEVDMRNMEEQMKQYCEKRMTELLKSEPYLSVHSVQKASSIMSSCGVIVNDHGKRTFKRRFFKRRFSCHYTGK